MNLAIIKEHEKNVLIDCLIKDQTIPSVETILQQITLIDDLLYLQKSRSLLMPTRTKGGKLRKDPTLKMLIERRIETDILNRHEY